MTREEMQNYNRQIDYREVPMERSKAMYWYRTQRHRLEGWLGGKVKGFHIDIDIVDACPMRCPTCPTGMELPRSGHRMEVDLFKRILDKMQKEVKIRRLQLYRWGDPLLHPKLHEFIYECVRRDIPVTTSSVLQSTACDFEKVLAAGLDEFRLSFTGWDHMHEYQKNAKTERFIKNLERISVYPRHPLTKWVMFFHHYRDNMHEIPRARELAERFGIEFYSFDATYMMYDRIITGKYDEADQAIIARLPETPEENIARIKDRSDYCNAQSKEITLDSYGRMQLCQMMYDEHFIMGDYLTTPLKELRRKIMRHPMCSPCKATGIPGYVRIFAQPAVTTKVVEEAERKYK